MVDKKADDRRRYRQLSLKERAAMLGSLIREPGWELLKGMFAAEIRTRITDTDAREAFLYEAVRAQVIQEIFSAPLVIMHQAEREWCSHPVHGPTHGSNDAVEKTTRQKRKKSSESTSE